MQIRKFLNSLNALIPISMINPPCGDQKYYFKIEEKIAEVNGLNTMTLNVGIALSPTPASLQIYIDKEDDITEEDIEGAYKNMLVSILSLAVGGSDVDEKHYGKYPSITPMRNAIKGVSGIVIKPISDIVNEMKQSDIQFIQDLFKIKIGDKFVESEWIVEGSIPDEVFTVSAIGKTKVKLIQERVDGYNVIARSQREVLKSDLLDREKYTPIGIVDWDKKENQGENPARSVAPDAT